MQKISEQIKQQVKVLRENGYSYDKISEELSIGKGSISNICKEFGLSQKIIELTPEKIIEVQKMYDEIGNIKEVARLSGISYNRLRNVIVSKKITPKTGYDNVKEYRKRTKQELVKYKGGKCQICGYNKCNEALDFHHLDPSQKDFSLSGQHKSIELLKKEVDKCILLCCRCHREVHAGVITL